MRHLTVLAIIGFLVGCTLVTKAENLTNNNNTTVLLLDLVDRDTTVSEVNPEDGKKKKKKKKSKVEEKETVVGSTEITVGLTPKQEKAYEEANMPSDDELEVIEIGIITPNTRFDIGSDDTEETMIMKVDEETGEEYFIRKSYAPSDFKELQNKRKYKRRAKKIEAQGMKSST